LADDDRAIAGCELESTQVIFEQSIRSAQSVDRRHSCSQPYSLFLSRYGGSYFGYRQAADADSIRYSLDSLMNAGKLSSDEHRWGVLALCMAMSRVATTTGHFAQPLRPKASNIRKFASQRRRSVRGEWESAIRYLRAVGTRGWRKKNLATRCDALDLLDDLRSYHTKPAVIYADPPYTKDQYSRYYHLLETIILYDFPSCEGVGLYRTDRATSAFSQTTMVEEAIDSLIERSCRLGSDLIISYPEDGLLPSANKLIPRMITDHYGRRPDILELSHTHSTMGASKGADKHAVREILYRIAA
jgi:adenine-specific DNA-methyltransferase